MLAELEETQMIFTYLNLIIASHHSKFITTTAKKTLVMPLDS